MNAFDFNEDKPRRTARTPEARGSIWLPIIATLLLLLLLLVARAYQIVDERLKSIDQNTTRTRGYP